MASRAWHEASAFPATPVPPAAPKTRLAWPDVAKGISILGVVALHICLEVPHGMETFIAGVNHILDPLRLCLFFLVSGLFSRKVLHLTFGQLWCRRLWFFAVPYVIFTPIEMAIKRHQWLLLGDTDLPGWRYYLYTVLSSENMYWFLWALIAFNIFLWVTRKLPRWLALALTFFPVLILPLAQDYPAVSQALMFLPVFMAGVHFSTAIKDFAAGANPARIVASVAFYVSGFAVYAMWRVVAEVGLEPVAWPLCPVPAQITPDEMWLVVRAFGQALMLPAAVLGAVGIAKIPVLSTGLQFLGRHTLPIYLGHPIALTLVYTPLFMAAEGMEVNGQSSDPLTRTGVWMALGAVASLLGSFAFWLLAQIPVLGWAVKPPRLEPLLARVLGTQLSDNGAGRRAEATQPASSGVGSEKIR